jgi:hypothetical protein
MDDTRQTSPEILGDTGGTVDGLVPPVLFSEDTVSPSPADGSQAAGQEHKGQAYPYNFVDVTVGSAIVGDTAISACNNGGINVDYTTDGFHDGITSDGKDMRAYTSDGMVNFHFKQGPMSSLAPAAVSLRSVRVKVATIKAPLWRLLVVTRPMGTLPISRPMVWTCVRTQVMDMRTSTQTDRRAT